MDRYRDPRYTRTAVVLHWMVAVFVILNVFLAWSLDFWPEKYQQPAGDAHKSIGITVFCLALMRILWRLSHRPPALSEKLKRWELLTARITHTILYVLIFAMPLSGWLFDSAWEDGAQHPIHFFGLFNFPRLAYVVDQPTNIKKQFESFFGAMHTSLAYVLYAFVVMHIVGALKHQFIDREPLLRRMSLSNRRSR